MRTEVVARVGPAPSWQRERQRAPLSRTDVIDDSRLVLNNTSSYVFDRVYSETQTLADIFENCGRPVVDAALSGSTSVLVAIGAHNSGKRQLMLGSPDTPGLLPQMVHHIYNELRGSTTTGSIAREQVRAVLCEIASESFTDLLSPGANTAQLRCVNDVKHGVLVSNLYETTFATAEPMTHLLCSRLGVPRERSNVSHCLTFLIRPTPTASDDAVGKLTVLLLADDEGCDPKDVGLQVGTPQTTPYWLKSLHNCLSALENKKASVPYHNSRATTLLKECLQGTATATVMAAVTPSVQESARVQLTLETVARMRAVLEPRLATIRMPPTATATATLNHRLASGAREALRDRSSDGDNDSAHDSAHGDIGTIGAGSGGDGNGSAEYVSGHHGDVSGDGDGGGAVRLSYDISAYRDASASPSGGVEDLTMSVGIVNSTDLSVTAQVETKELERLRSMRRQLQAINRSEAIGAITGLVNTVASHHGGTNGDGHALANAIVIATEAGSSPQQTRRAALAIKAATPTRALRRPASARDTSYSQRNGANNTVSTVQSSPTRAKGPAAKRSDVRQPAGAAGKAGGKTVDPRDRYAKLSQNPKTTSAMGAMGRSASVGRSRPSSVGSAAIDTELSPMKTHRWASKRWNSKVDVPLPDDASVPEEFPAAYERPKNWQHTLRDGNVATNANGDGKNCDPRDMAAMRAQLKKACEELRESKAAKDAVKAELDVALARIEKMQKGKADTQRSLRFHADKTAKAEERQEELLKETSAMKAKLDKAKVKYEHARRDNNREVQELKNENECLRRWIEGLLGELKRHEGGDQRAELLSPAHLLTTDGATPKKPTTAKLGSAVKRAAGEAEAIASEASKKLGGHPFTVDGGIYTALSQSMKECRQLRQDRDQMRAALASSGVSLAGIGSPSHTVSSPSGVNSNRDGSISATGGANVGGPPMTTPTFEGRRQLNGVPGSTLTVGAVSPSGDATTGKDRDPKGKHLGDALSEAAMSQSQSAARAPSLTGPADSASQAASVASAFSGGDRVQTYVQEAYRLLAEVESGIKRDEETLGVHSPEVKL